MKDHKPHLKDSTDLRRRAEARLKEKADRSPQDFASMSSEAIMKIMHELRVHQIELEMQNEELRRAQRELNTSRERYFDLYDLAPVGYITLSEQGLILEANQTTAGLLGVGRSSLVKQPLSRIILKEDQDIFTLHHKQLFESGDPQNCDLRMLKNGDRIFWAHMVMTASQDGDDTHLCRVVISNITVRKQVELFSRNLVNMNPVSIQVLDKDGFTLDVNPAFKKLFGSVPPADYSIFNDLQLAQKGLGEVFDQLRSGSVVHFPDVSFNPHDSIPEMPDVPNWVRTIGFPICFDNDCPDRFILMQENITEQKNSEKELRESEYKFRQTFDISPIGIVMVGLDKRFINCNLAFSHSLGYKAEELVGKLIEDVTLPEDNKIGITEMLAIVKGEISESTVQKRYQRKDGQVIWGETTISLIRDSIGNAQYFLALIQNITERKKMEEKLVNEANRRRILMEQSKDGIVIINQDGKVIESNQKFSEMLGYPFEEMCHLSVFDWEFLTPSERLKEMIKNIDKKGDHFETKHRRKDGSVYDVEISTNAAWFDRQKLIFCICRDITEQKRIVQELSLKSLVLDQIQDHVTITDLEGTITYVNVAESKTMGISVEQLIGRSTSIYGDNAEKGATQKEIVEKTLQEGSWRCEIVNYSQDGSEHYMDCRTQVIQDAEGKPIAFCGISTDISERKRLENALNSRLVALTRPLDQPEAIQFSDLFELDEIQRLQDQFSEATGVASIITNLDGTPITHPSKFCQLCQDIIRNTEQGQLNCHKSDAMLGRFHPDGPIIQPCLSGGLWDAGASISVGGKHIANWLIGQVRTEIQSEEKIREYARTIGGNEGDAVTAFQKVPVMSMEKFEQIAQALFTMSKTLSNMAYQNVQQARFITERKQAGKALEESERNLRNSQQIAHLGSWRLDVATNQVVWTEELYHMYGFDPALPPPPYTEHIKLFTPASWEVLSTALAKTTETGIPYELELETVKKDGNNGWVWVRGEVTKDSDGNTVGLWGAAQDISERKQTEARINQQLNELKRWHSITLGREDRVLELKREVNKLLEEAGKPPHYSSVE